MTIVPLLFAARAKEGWAQRWVGSHRRCCSQEGIKEFLLAFVGCEASQTTVAGLWKYEAGNCRRGTCLAPSPGTWSRLQIRSLKTGKLDLGGLSSHPVASLHSTLSVMMSLNPKPKLESPRGSARFNGGERPCFPSSCTSQIFLLLPR